MRLVKGGSTTQLTMSDAVAAIIRTPQGKLLLQLRDNIPNIWYPALWGCFGGSIEKGELPLEALSRELYEELELTFTTASLVSRLVFDLRPSGLDSCFREYYLVEPTEDALKKMVLHEGERMAAFTHSELADIPMTPYDGFALHLFWAGKTCQLTKM